MAYIIDSHALSSKGENFLANTYRDWASTLPPLPNPERTFMFGCYHGEMEYVRRYLPRLSRDCAVSGAKLACLCHQREVLDYLFTQLGVQSLEQILPIAYLAGDLVTVNLLLPSGRYRNQAFQYAYMNGTEEVIRHADENLQVNWNDGLAGACWGGHLELIKKCCRHADILSIGLWNAFRQEHLEATRFMIEKGARDSYLIELGFRDQDQKIVDLIFEMKAEGRVRNLSDEVVRTLLDRGMDWRRLGPRAPEIAKVREERARELCRVLLEVEQGFFSELVERCVAVYVGH